MRSPFAVALVLLLGFIVAHDLLNNDGLVLDQIIRWCDQKFQTVFS